jgi:DNA (cytosine-5)-methyltransferase 1
LFAGIGGFDLGFEWAGFKTVWQVEKEKFCIAVLKTRFPNVERYYEVKDCGNGRKHKLRAVDVVTAGFPCQDLSVAGKRAGLAGSRSGLFWEVIRIVGEIRPSWLVLENVPGLFSSDDGRDFAIVLRELAKLRLFQSIAWTVLDSRFFGVAQRRHRVFIVCGPRTGSAEAVLFESESGARDSQESGEERPGTATDACDRIASPLRHSDGGSPSGGPRGGNGENIVAQAMCSKVTGTLRCEYGDQSYRGDGTDRHAVCGAFNSGAGASARGIGYVENGSPTLRGNNGGNKTAVTYECSEADSNGVRDFASLPEGLDSARYRALGNAVTVNVAQWIAERIKAYSEARGETV